MRALLLATLLLGFTALPARAQDAGTPPAPADVQAFLDQRDKCAHFADEDAYDAARQKFLADQIKRYCTDIDQKQAKLQKKYKDNPGVLALIQASPDD